MRVVDATTNTTLATDAGLARSFGTRLVGLLGKTGLQRGEGLVIVPCQSIHTWFMRFPIDALFLDEDGIVLKTYHRLRSFRATRVIRGAKAVVELPAGTLDELGTEPGNKLELYEGKFLITKL